MRKDLTASQNDYARFLPALSGFYATYVGKQRFDEYVDKSRIPANFPHGCESLNYLNKDQGAFTYQWTLYSAGNADLDTTKDVPKEDMVRNRDRENSWILGDSGGFQIGKGVWEGEWRDPNGPEVAAKMAEAKAKGIEQVPQLDETGNQKVDKHGNPKFTKIDHAKQYQARLDAAQQKRDSVLRWMDAYMDYGMILDIPAWVCRSPAGREKTGISTYQDAVNASKYNNEYWMKHRNGNCKFLNVLQGETHDEADDWYEQMKDFCDPAKYPENHFNGWAMGGQNMCDVHLVLKRLITLHFDGLLEKGVHDVMHFLGTSKLEWALLLTDIQRAVRKYHNPKFTISFDCASPFLATANGMLYTYNKYPNRDKWSYKMESGVDDKKYAVDSRLFGDVLRDDAGLTFTDGPISKHLKVSDVCIYKPGDLNKNGKEGKTSWDSFTYMLLMSHNVYSHIESVQRANALTDMVNTTVSTDYRQWRKLKSTSKDEVFSPYVPRNIVYMTQFIDQLFRSETPMQMLDEAESMLANFSGQKLQTSSAGSFNNLFEVDDVVSEESNEMTPEQEAEAMDFLETLEK